MLKQVKYEAGYHSLSSIKLTCRSSLLPVSVHERAACPGNYLIHPPPNTTTITFVGCCDHMTSDQPIIALGWLHVVFASLSMESDIVAQCLQRNEISSELEEQIF